MVPTALTVTVNGHSLIKYIYKNTVNYFFGLPDGGSGAGFGPTGLQSLQRLKSGAITAMNVVGYTTSPPTSGPAAFTYTWAQLVATINAIIIAEKITGQQAWIYSASLDAVYNPGDHSDHLHSSIAAREAAPVATMPWVGMTEFKDYSSFQSGPNLNAYDHVNASILFGLAVWGITEDQYSNNFESGHLDWISMDVFRVFRAAVGNAPFTGGNTDNAVLAGSSKNIATDIVNSGLTSLTKIPMVVSVTNPVIIDKDIKMVISPYEAGQLNTSVYDMAGIKVYGLTTKVTNRELHFVTLNKAIKTKGTYILQNVLNDKYSESLKIVVE